MKAFLSQTAGEQLHQVIDYLEQRWSVKVRNNFISKLERSVDTIAQMDFLNLRVFPACANALLLFTLLPITGSMKRKKKSKL